MSSTHLQFYSLIPKPGKNIFLFKKISLMYYSISMSLESGFIYEYKQCDDEYKTADTRAS